MTTREDVTTAAPVIEARNIGVTLGGARVVDDVSLTVGPGDVLCLVGPSGAGKSTILKALSLLLRIDRGELYAFGKPVVVAREEGPRRRKWFSSSQGSAKARLLVKPELHRRTVGMVFQELNLWEDRSVLANLTEGPRHARHVPRHKANTDARELLGQFDLNHLEARRPHELSGGERQRIALVRALLMNPRVLLLDEITSALDPENVAAIHGMLRKLRSSGLTMIMTTHHLMFARKIASRVAMMEAGKIVEMGTAEEVLVTPRNERTYRFISRLEGLS